MQFKLQSGVMQRERTMDMDGKTYRLVIDTLITTRQRKHCNHCVYCVGKWTNEKRAI